MRGREGGGGDGSGGREIEKHQSDGGLIVDLIHN